MENNPDEPDKEESTKIVYLEDILKNQLNLTKNITIINLSERKLTDINGNFTFPPKLIELNLSHNRLNYIPKKVLEIKKLKILNLSYNEIKYFDDTPSFCNVIECLDLSYNFLQWLPYWICSTIPKRLHKLNLNNNLSASLINIDSQLYQRNNVLKEFHAYNCRLKGSGYILFKYYPKIKYLYLGTPEYSNIAANNILEIPLPGLDTSCDIEVLNLCNTNIYTVHSNICLYTHMVELDLSQNCIGVLPVEFCELANLEKCILSNNKLLYLPTNMYKLKKLKILCLDSNELCMMFENLQELCHLSLLDLYDNNLYEVPDLSNQLEKLDLALNFFEDPEDEEYLLKKRKLRGNIVRFDGRKEVITRPESENSEKSIEDDEELVDIINIANKYNDLPETEERLQSSPEDWDSDEYWVPMRENIEQPAVSPWHYYVQRKIEDGNFCPIDYHAVSITEKVRYEKLCNPQQPYESDGQFDDYSDDNS